MKKFFRVLTDAIDNSAIPNDKIREYRALVVKEMEQMRASSHEIALLQDAAVRNAIRQECQPKDLAWAIMQ